MSDTRQNRSEQVTFRLEQLWTDTRYRSLFIQTIALIAFLTLIGWLIWNAKTNMDALGKRFSFAFLFEPASYDINQSLIEYSSRSSHLRAAFVGILNTLLIAVLGCAAATLIGVVAGVLRLSKNWIISSLMTLYVEVTRNIPVLLHILLCYTVFINFLPKPRQAESYLWGGVIPTNRGFYGPWPVFETGAYVVIAVFFLSLPGLFFFRSYAKKHQERTGKKLPSFWISWGILILPTVVTYFVMGSPIALDLPVLKGFNYQGGIYLRASFLALWFSLSIYTGAFIAETVRSGILSVDHGQIESASALGLRSNPVMRLVILPQALRVIIPPLISQYLNLTKNSSLAIAVGYMDITGTLGGITLNQTGREMETLLLLMAFYLLISLAISGGMNIYNRRVKFK